MKDFSNASDPRFAIKYALFIDGIIEKDGHSERKCKSSRSFKALDIKPQDRVKELWLGVVPFLQPRENGNGKFRFMTVRHELDTDDIFETQEEAKAKFDEIKKFLEYRNVTHIQNETIRYLKTPQFDKAQLTFPPVDKGDSVWFVSNKTHSPKEIKVHEIITETAWNDLEDALFFSASIYGLNPENRLERHPINLFVNGDGSLIAVDQAHQERGLLFADPIKAYEHAIKSASNLLTDLKTNAEKIRQPIKPQYRR
jgi:hypothetical protein